MRRVTLLAAFAVMPVGLSAQPAQSDWRVAATDSEGEGGRSVGRSIGFVDLNSMSRDGDRVSFILEVHFINQRNANGPNAMLSHMQAECSARRWSTTDTILYHDGNEVGRNGGTPSEAVEPSSNGYVVLTAVCTGQFQTGPIIDRSAYAHTFLTPK